MPNVTFMPMNVTVRAEAGNLLLDIARSAGVEIEAPCGGKGTCGKCIVRIVKGDVDSTRSLGVLSRAEVADGYVLACVTQVGTVPIEVDVPEQIGRKGGKFTDAREDSSLVRQDLFPRNWQFDPLAVKWCVTVPPPRAEDGLSDLDRLTRAIQTDWGRKEIVYPLSVVRRVASSVRGENGAVTVTLIRGPDRYQVVGIEAGFHAEKHYGIAIDIGTTTIAVELVYLPMAEPVGTRTDYNDQIVCGLDVISRINHARRPGGLDELRRRVLETVNRLIRQIAQRHSVDLDDVCNAVVSGNTTMMHLLLGLDPEYIRLEPYTPTIHGAPYITAREVDLAINPESWVALSPCVGSYVGGDITAGILCTDLATGDETVNLFIDIGTNGEMVVGNRDFLIACACSAGPAFEGGGIRHGMRAAVGAIEDVRIDAETGFARYETIGNVKPKGICGSGMIALIARLFLTGWIDAAGKLDRTRSSPSIRIEGRHGIYVVAAADDTDDGREITIGETDIENIVRTKAAIYSACALMLKRVDLSFTDIGTIYIAGGFGRFLDLDMAVAIGLIPDLPRERYKYIGNSSLTGTFMVLVSQEFRERQAAVAARMTYLDLGTDPEYMDQYTSALFLPHTDIGQFPTVASGRKG